MVRLMQLDVDTKEFATLLSRFTGIDKDYLMEYLKDHPVNTIFEHPGTLNVTEQQSEKLHSLSQLRGLYNNLKQHESRYQFSSVENAGAYFVDFFPEMRDREYAVCAYLDNRLQLIKSEIISVGTINAAFFTPRDVVKRGLEIDCTAICLAHNHPSGLPEPSLADIETTNRIEEGLETVGIRLIDHFIIGEYGQYRHLRDGEYKEVKTFTDHLSFEEPLVREESKTNDDFSR